MMWRTWSALSTCLTSSRTELSSHNACTRKRMGVGGTALGEAVQSNDTPKEAELRLQPGASTSGRDGESPRAIVGASPFVGPASPNAGGSPSAKAAASYLSQPTAPASPCSYEQQPSQQSQQQQQQPQQPEQSQQPQQRPQLQTVGEQGAECGSSFAAAGSALKGGRASAAAVRFAPASPGGGSEGAPAAAPTGQSSRGDTFINTSGAGGGGSGGTRDGKAPAAAWRPSRVRLMLPTDTAPEGSSGPSGGAGSDDGDDGPAAAGADGSEGAAAESRRRVPSRGPSTASVSLGRADGGSRALSHLAGLLLSKRVDFRGELEALIATHGSVLPGALLEQWLRRSGVALSQRRLRAIVKLYRVTREQEEEQEGEEEGEEEGEGEQEGKGRDEEDGRASERGKRQHRGTSEAGDGEDDGDGGKLDGSALLRDLDRAAFRQLALEAISGGAPSRTSMAAAAAATAAAAAGDEDASSVSGQGGPPGPSTTAAASSRRSMAPTGQLGDKARILQLVATRLAEDETLRIHPGTGEGLTQEHLQEVVEHIDLTSVAVPVGTRVPYVPSTDEPDSFQVPVWSLRAMQRRKQKRDQLLIGSDPALRQLGQAGREALRQRITRRSLFQQEEIIANAVLAAARAAVAPAARRTETALTLTAPQLPQPSRTGSLQRTGSSNSSSNSRSPLRRSATSIAADSAAAAAAAAATAAATVTVTAAAAAATAGAADSMEWRGSSGSGRDGGGGGGGGGGGDSGQTQDEVTELGRQRSKSASLRLVDADVGGGADSTSTVTVRPGMTASVGTDDGGGAGAGAGGSDTTPAVGPPAASAGGDAGGGGAGGGSCAPLVVRPSPASTRSGAGDGGGGWVGGGTGTGDGGGGSPSLSTQPSSARPSASGRKALAGPDGGVILSVAVISTERTPSPSPLSSPPPPPQWSRMEQASEGQQQQQQQPQPGLIWARKGAPLPQQQQQQPASASVSAGLGASASLLETADDEMLLTLLSWDQPLDGAKQPRGDNGTGGGGGGGGEAGGDRGGGGGRSEHTRAATAAAGGLQSWGYTGAAASGGAVGAGAEGLGRASAVGDGAGPPVGQRHLLLLQDGVNSRAPPRPSEAGPPLSPQALKPAARNGPLPKAYSNSLYPASYTHPAPRAVPLGSHVSAPVFEDADSDVRPDYSNAAAELPGQCITSEWPQSTSCPHSPQSAASYRARAILGSLAGD
ncbi:hypothetical protein PLESTB_000860500 [Pleodorina starrii]|uniref:Uncharacterized protein n=1 Tax=Pleodorina starrii TaxID=330485 RepID=A0A9W6BLQ3_9CHLO|nr:hypothetical protein PLESTM_001433500 [Pleodorina starrii]GLC54409.1 hypothetical protein PLESTB_000860500 [Pleodorina starrii]GLC72060.1 hypothetical protein PLESTF_001199700 [Pleodorina starrii]